MKRPSRRQFLQSAAVSTLIVGLPSILRALTADKANAPAIQAWLTDENSRCKPVTGISWNSASTPRADIQLLPQMRYQQILGFGGAFTEASCYLLHQMQDKDRHALLEELYGQSGLRLSVGRTCIGASDYSRTPYTFDDSTEPDPELKHFSIEHDRACILPVLREALAINPSLYLFSSPWTPPAWMKMGNTLFGGTMPKLHMEAYAQYFVRFLQEYRAAGVPIQAITSQNEVDTHQDGRMPACQWGQEYEITFIKEHLAPALHKAGLDTKIWLLDHNYNLWGRVLDQLSDPQLAAVVDGVAWHGYVGSPESMTRVQEAYPDKNAYWTEGGPDYTAPDYATDWCKWSSTFSGILRNRARCIVAWNLLLDEQGRPNLGPFPCGGLVTQDSKTGALTRSGQYWAYAHFARQMERGSTVIGSSSSLPDVDHVASVNVRGETVAVLTNRGAKRDLTLQLQEKTVQLHLPANAVLTVKMV